MTLEWEGADIDREANRRAAQERQEFARNRVGEEVTLANEFSEIRVYRVETRTGSRLMIESPKSGQWVTMDPLELEALTWQTPATFSALVGHPHESLYKEDW